MCCHPALGRWSSSCRTRRRTRATRRARATPRRRSGRSGRREHIRGRARAARGLRAACERHGPPASGSCRHLFTEYNVAHTWHIVAHPWHILQLRGTCVAHFVVAHAACRFRIDVPRRMRGACVAHSGVCSWHIRSTFVAHSRSARGRPASIPQPAPGPEAAARGRTQAARTPGFLAERVALWHLQPACGRRLRSDTCWAICRTLQAAVCHPPDIRRISGLNPAAVWLAGFRSRRGGRVS